MSTELVIALDYNDQHKADKLIKQLNGLSVIYKVGLELFLAADSQWVKNLCANGVRVFLDLKFHDIPNTTSSAVVQAAKIGAEFTTVHLSGGRRMLDEIDVRLQESMISGEIKQRPKVLGVSVLTSFKEEEWIANVSHMAKITGVRTIEDSVLHFANLASDHPGVQGMVCAPHEVAAIRRKYAQVFLMVPGIRPEGAARHDQARVMTPGEARSAGASAIVMGRPIIQAPNPRTVVEEVLKEIS